MTDHRELLSPPMKATAATAAWGCTSTAAARWRTSYLNATGRLPRGPRRRASRSLTLEPTTPLNRRDAVLPCSLVECVQVQKLLFRNFISYAFPYTPISNRFTTTQNRESGIQLSRHQTSTDYRTKAWLARDFKEQTNSVQDRKLIIQVEAAHCASEHTPSSREAESCSSSRRCVGAADPFSH